MFRKIKYCLQDGNIRLSNIARRNKMVASLLVCAVKQRDRIKGKQVDKQIDDTVLLFRPGIEKEEFRKIKRDVWRSREVYLIDPDEYFLYDFEKLSDSERHEFVGNREKELVCMRINHGRPDYIFNDKFESYQKFKDYYKREAIMVTSEKDIDAFEEFAKKHKRVIAKITNLSRGRGIFIVDTSVPDELSKAVETIKKNLSHHSSFIVEECIVQSDFMAKLNKSSVNTVRIATFKMDDKIEVLYSSLRIGRAGSVVDNGGSGGLFCGIDLTTGQVITDGCDEKGGCYEYHPDSNEKIKGLQIPHWEQVLSLVRELALVVPDQLYVGWDLAYTDNGWIMIEGNAWSQFVVYQIPRRSGIRKYLDNTMYRYLKQGEDIK